MPCLDNGNIVLENRNMREESPLLHRSRPRGGIKPAGDRTLTKFSNSGGCESESGGLKIMFSNYQRYCAISISNSYSSYSNRQL